MYEIPKFTDFPLKKRAQAYLRELFLFCHHEFGEHLRSMVLFGSHARGTASDISDVDVIIIIDDTISRRRLRNLRGKIEWLETKHGYFIESKGIMRFFRALERTTGMFVSHFICRETDFLEGEFSKIFGVNRLLSSMLAPSEVVLFNIQQHAVTIWGVDLVTKMRVPQLSTGQLMKSMIMNILQATGTLLLAPITEESTLRALESLKWSIHTTTAWLFHDSMPLVEGIQKLVPKPGFLQRYLKILLTLRRKYHVHPKILILSPFLVFLIHRKAVKQAHLT